eukprot:5300428-Pyramimonas_sp.AAC.1
MRCLHIPLPSLTSGSAAGPLGPSRDNRLELAPRSPEGEGNVCKLCLEASGESELDELVAPCACRGSSQYIHKSCLKKWHRSLGNPERYVLLRRRTVLTLIIVAASI